MIQKVVFIGAGNLATCLSQDMKAKGFTVSQVFSRTQTAAHTLGILLDCPSTNKLSEIQTDADLYIFALKDDVLHSVLEQMPATKGIWVHTAGSVTMDIFQPFHPNYGVFYPLQTFSKTKKVDFEQIPFFIEGNNDTVTTELLSTARKLSHLVYSASSEQRKYLHLSAVFACNFANHMYDIAQRLCQDHDLPFDALKPLIAETAQKIETFSPKDAQTGPAIRDDHSVMSKHLELLSDPHLKMLYELISKNIHEYANK